MPLKTLLSQLARASAALARLDERLAHSWVGTGLMEGLHFADACASLSIDGELVEMEVFILHEEARDKPELSITEFAKWHLMLFTVMDLLL